MACSFFLVISGLFGMFYLLEVVDEDGTLVTFCV